jgi:exonuclease SbcD
VFPYYKETDNSYYNMKILHTSDWHLGRLLYGQKRYNEFDRFLNWLIEFIREQQIDAVLVAGDIFDTTTPGNSSQELYYQFLYKASKTCCRHIVITGGNHDSPTFLDAPKQLLKAMNVYVVGEMCADPADEVITLRDADGKPEAIICAVPYLRDRDIRTVDSGETLADKSQKLITGISMHYQQVAAVAEKRESGSIPVIGMGHLFTSTDRKNDGDGVRELYVGTLAYIDGSMFPKAFDYLALGHLHIAQRVGNSETIRYSGSPVPMGFNEASQTKKVIVVEFSGKTPTITEHEIPRFQKLYRIEGDLTTIKERIDELKSRQESAWLEIELTSGDLVTNLTELINNQLDGSYLEALLIRNKQIELQLLSRTGENETLEDLEPEDVFIRCLDANSVSEELQKELIVCYKEIITRVLENDSNAE